MLYLMNMEKKIKNHAIKNNYYFFSSMLHYFLHKKK